MAGGWPASRAGPPRFRPMPSGYGSRADRHFRFLRRAAIEGRRVVENAGPLRGSRISLGNGAHWKMQLAAAGARSHLTPQRILVAVRMDGRDERGKRRHEPGRCLRAHPCGVA